VIICRLQPPLSTSLGFHEFMPWWTGWSWFRWFSGFVIAVRRFSRFSWTFIDLNLARSSLNLARSTLNLARSGMISALTSSSCFLKHEGYHRGPKSCAVLDVPAWLPTRGNFHTNVISLFYSLVHIAISVAIICRYGWLFDVCKPTDARGTNPCDQYILFMTPTC